MNPEHRSELKIPPGGPFPIKRKVTVGLDKSMLVEVPTALQNVLVSNPDVVDAVVQTSQQVYLLGKFAGEANVHFMGPDGRKILYLEVTVARDVSALRDTLHRLIPGSSINAEMMGDTVVLTGVVATPIQANRAAELAAKFVKKKDGVVNMLNTESKEQVLLKVQVAEIQRDALRRIGVDLPGSILSSGNLRLQKCLRTSSRSPRLLSRVHRNCTGNRNHLWPQVQLYIQPGNQVGKAFRPWFRRWSVAAC